MKHITIRSLLMPLAFAVWITSGELTLKEEEQDKPIRTITQCILSILNEYFKNSKKIALRYDDHDEHQKTIIRELFKQADNPIMLNAEEHSMGIQLDIRIPNDAMIIFDEDVNVTNHLETNLYTARTAFFTVIREKSEGMGRIFAAFWNYNVVNAFALEVQMNEVNVYEYIPYVNCNMSEPVLLDIWSENGFRHGRMNRIGVKHPVRQVNGCTLTVTVPHIPPTIIFPDETNSSVISGIEGRIWMTIASIINSTFRYKTPDDGTLWGFLRPKPSGAVGEIIQKKSHFAGGGPAATLERIVYLEAIVGTSGSSDVVVWAVPTGAAKSEPVWLSVYTVEFSYPTWICLGFVLFFTMVTYSAFSRFTNASSGIFESFLVLFSVSLGGTVRIPRSVSLKTLIASWTWYSMIILTAYESSMRSSLTVPMRHKDINTFRDVIESGIDLYGVDTTIGIVLRKASDPYEDAMSNKVKVWNASIEEILSRVAKERNLGYMREKLTLDYFLFNHTELIGMIHQARQYLYMYYQTIYMSKRFPALDRIQKTVSRLRESGIPAWWRSQFARESYPSPPKAVKLTTEHITAPFIILGLGTVLATIAFIAERVKYKKCRKRDMRNHCVM